MPAVDGHTLFLALKSKSAIKEFESKKRGAGLFAPCSKARQHSKQKFLGGRMKRMLAILLVGLASSSPAHAGDSKLLTPGEYEVQMRLELPHIEDMGVSKTSKICVTDAATHGLIVLSDNNPLVRCPASNVRQDGETLTFDLVCEGHNQAVAWAKFQLAEDRFDGVFDMKMGGKNMTMTERQSGHRVGACTTGVPHS